MKSYILRTVLISLLVCLMGCGSVIKTYSGPELPEQQIAILTCDCDVRLLYMDQTKIDKKGGCTFGQEHNTFLLLPGHHAILISFGTALIGGPGGRTVKTFFSLSEATIQFEAMAGHKYHIYSGAIVGLANNRYNWDPFIVDISDNNKIIARGSFN